MQQDRCARAEEAAHRAHSFVDRGAGLLLGDPLTAESFWKSDS